VSCESHAEWLRETFRLSCEPASDERALAGASPSRIYSTLVRAQHVQALRTLFEPLARIVGRAVLDDWIARTRRHPPRDEPNPARWANALLSTVEADVAATNAALDCARAIVARVGVAIAAERTFQVLLISTDLETGVGRAPCPRLFSRDAEHRAVELDLDSLSVAALALHEGDAQMLARVTELGIQEAVAEAAVRLVRLGVPLPRAHEQSTARQP
jgi:hypothetical protein